MYNSAEGRLRAKVKKSTRRLRQTFPDIDHQVFRDMMTSIERGFKSLAQELADTPLFADRNLGVMKCARRVMPDDDSALRWSAAG